MIQQSRFHQLMKSALFNLSTILLALDKAADKKKV